MPIVNTKSVIDNRVEAIRSFHITSGVTRAELDVSGGIDSAVMLLLLSLAIGPDSITAVYQGINSSPESLSRAREVAAVAGVKLVEWDGTEVYSTVVRGLVDAMVAAGYDRTEIETRVESDPTILGSIRSTMRAPWGRAANRLTGGGIRHGTGNEDEDRTLRFYQKGGDGEVDTNPIAMFSKGEIFQLAKALGCPESILTAKPTPDLWGVGEVHNDEEEIAAYLRLSGTSYPMYSYINADGEYTCVGLVERFQRWLDDVGESIFDDSLTVRHVDIYIDRAVTSPLFMGVDRDTVAKLVTSMRRVERMTRHKLNPGIPTLGSRSIPGLVNLDKLTAIL